MPGLSAASTTGDPGDALIVAVSGRVKVVVHSADGGELHLQEGIQLAARPGDGFELLNGLDSHGYLCAATGSCAEALTLWAALAALLRHEGFTEPPAKARRRHESLREARQVLGPAGTAAPGAGKLSVRERELVVLVAQGRTNAQIAAQLYISVRTVSSHLDRIRDKTGCRRRADLTRLALTVSLI
jgi:DNA-binding CsgD family transcriptional regulator